jgi:hypothetical protein
LKCDFPDLLVEIRVVESSPGVESVHGMPDSYLPVDDARAHRAEHLAKFGLRPDVVRFAAEPGMFQGKRALESGRVSLQGTARAHLLRLEC